MNGCELEVCRERQTGLSSDCLMCGHGHNTRLLLRSCCLLGRRSCCLEVRTDCWSKVRANCPSEGD